MKLLRRLLLALLVFIVAGYAGVVGYMFINQRALQYDARGEVFALGNTALTGARDVLIASDGEAVSGWYAPPRPGMPVIVYYKGNSKSFTEEHERYERFVADGYGLLAFDYRGFPASPGAISEANILADALAAYDWLDAETDAPLGPLAGLGTGHLRRQPTRCGRPAARNALPVGRQRGVRTLSDPSCHTGHAGSVPQ